MTADVVVTRPFMNADEWGLYALCYMQVCAYGETPPDRIVAAANAANPSGVGEWHLATEGPHGEDLSPVPCQDDPARLHHMLSC